MIEIPHNRKINEGDEDVIRIEASYAATDGSAPEHITIEWDDNAPVPSGGELRLLIDGLANVPRRYEIRDEDTQP